MISADFDLPQTTTAACTLADSRPLSAAFGKMGAFGSCASIKMLGPMQYHSELQTKLEEMQAAGHYFDASVVVPELSSDVIDCLVKYTRELHPNKLAGVIIFPLGGAVADHAVGSTAFYGGGRKPRSFWIIIEGKFEPVAKEGARAEVVEWVKALRSALSKFGVSETAHTLDGNMEAAMGGLHDIFGPNVARLRQVKARYDPSNYFRCNRNIEPAGK